MYLDYVLRKKILEVFGGTSMVELPVIKNLPSNAGDIGLITGQGTKTPHDTGQLSPHTPTTEPLGSEPAHHKIASTAKVKKKKVFGNNWHLDYRNCCMGTTVQRLRTTSGTINFSWKRVKNRKLCEKLYPHTDLYIDLKLTFTV